MKLLEFLPEATLSALVGAAATILIYAAKYIVEFLKVKTEALKSTTENETVKTYIDLIYDNAVNIVVSLNQSIVDNLRAATDDGKLSEEDIKMISEMALNTLMDTLSDDIKKTINKVFGDVETYLAGVIEKAVVAVKNNTSAKG